MEFDAARKLFLRAEYDEREGRVDPAALATRLADVAPVTHAVHALLGLATLRDGARVLDLGCGAGAFALAAARAAPRVDVIGADLSPRAVEAARAGARALGLANARFDVADFENATLPRADGIVIAYALSLAGDPAAALANARDALAPGARVVVFDAYLPGALARLDALASRVGCPPGKRLDLSEDVRRLAAAGRWPWANAPAAEARFVATAFAPTSY